MKIRTHGLLESFLWNGRNMMRCLSNSIHSVYTHTIAYQIALFKCNAYNNKICAEIFSFEAALTDAVHCPGEMENCVILTGAVDELNWNQSVIILIVLQ